MGSHNKVHFIDVTNPTNPVLKAEFTGGSSSFWRDIKIYDRYAYSVADQGNEGLIIYDLNALPNGKLYTPIRIKRHCDQIYEGWLVFDKSEEGLSLTFLIHNTIPNSPVTELPVCEFNAENDDFIWIDKITLNGELLPRENNGDPLEKGYSNYTFTSSPVELMAGQSYNIQFERASIGNYGSFWLAYVNLN